jgi:hypothetical protein
VERALLPAAFDFALTFDELIEGAAELGGLTFAGEFFFDRPGWRARAASPCSRMRFLRRLTCPSLSESSAAALAHAMFPFARLEITLARCNSF